MAERVYPAVYVFENCLRDIIERVLSSRLGFDWWAHMPSDVKKRFADHKSDEDRNPWHGKRGNRELDYILLTDLVKIVRAQWVHFSPLFPNLTWLESVVSDLNVSRRVLAHMNPLSDDDIQSIEVAFKKWMKQLQANEALLP
ncbi:MAG TPA: Swt1 family HEPN domain-containing protein [Thermoanaerobaculia bacterium]